ncbi:MAG: hypothetical protein FD123_1810 [Bacteroidetes bacterium]|nr:MAG: hypothetical protein FD123_1810 [Bacteroidota bacterium]
MKIIVQSIIVHWSKDFRGGKNAVIRNQVPEALELPIEIFTSPKLIAFHEIRYDFYPGSNQQPTVYFSFSDKEHVQLRGAYIDIKDNRLMASYKYDHSHCGFPYRTKYNPNGVEEPLDEEAFVLTKGEYGRIRFNGKYTDSDGYWYYEKKVHNLLIMDSPKRDEFTKRAPLKTYEQMELLR